MSAVLEAAGDGFRIVGALDFDSVPTLYRATDELLARSPVRLELGAVERGDSAGVALLLEWCRQAHRRDVELTVAHVPESLLRVARLSGVEDLLTGRASLSARVADPV